MEQNGELDRSTGSRPVPDPTVLTDQLVTKATQALREILETRIGGLEGTVNILQSDIRKRPEAITQEIHHLRELHEEKFRTVAEQFTGVQTQFMERDVRVRDAALANTTAINAALQSQKEAAGEQAKSFTLSIDKSEKGTLEQIAQQRELLKTTTDSLKENVADLKDRLTRIESIGVGKVQEIQESRATHTSVQSGNQYVVYLILAGIVVIGFLLDMASRFIR